MRNVHATAHVLAVLSCAGLMPACTGSSDPDTPTVASIAIVPGAPFSITLGSEDTVTAAVTGLAGGATFSSSQPAVATVNAATGVVQAVALGTASITATSTSNPTLQDVVQVTVVPVGPSHREMMSDFINEVCPNEEEQLFADSIPVEADIPIIHEFHDCQRLISANQYQSLVGIFAHRNVANYTTPSQFTKGRLAAVIINFRTKRQNRMYEPLGLAPGTNCLVLKWTPGRQARRGAPGGSWEAAIIHATSPTLPYGDCPDNLAWTDVPASQMNRLDVKPQLNGAAPNDDPLSPPVARWDWDAAKGENYMGVRCGEVGWCEIGARNFTPLPALRTSTGKNIFKGYYDEQYLADQAGRKSDVWGTLSPGVDASVRDPERHIQRNSRWYEVAKIDLNAPTIGSNAFAYYAKGLHLQVSQQGNGITRGTGSMNISSAPLQMPYPPGARDWDVEVNGGSVAGGRMKHRSHPSEGANRRGTVRWRWNAEDETVWSFCPEVGCCEMGRF